MLRVGRLFRNMEGGVRPIVPLPSSPSPESSPATAPSAEASSSLALTFDSPPSPLPEQTASYQASAQVWEGYVATPRAASSPTTPTAPA